MRTKSGEGRGVKSGSFGVVNNFQIIPQREQRPSLKWLITDIAEVRSQNSEVRTQNSELRTQKSELRSQNSEVRTQNSEVRTQNSEVRTQNSEVRSQTLALT
ncbi:MAG: hypothetical protein F6J94_12110 [Moorea sp. SIO1F2]|uniref:hypothetical protein n=1 Tax=Moorena sp. SIO1F2 TaxID=2607819 RepID=UPI0013BB1FF5|nr:hypothetical protein [Moorena sp. SIO1F2]NET82647.1 hypothetical protein [Moorena sp. SIO1F2]